MVFFKSYDIRGKENDFTFEIVQRIGKAFEIVSKTKTVFVGMDNRISSKRIKEALISGINVKVVDLGEVATPMLYYIVSKLGDVGGIMITASHLGKGYNGFKFISKKGVMFSYDVGLNDIADLMKRNIVIGYLDNLVEERNLEEEYLNWILSKVKVEKKLKIVVDGGNGIAGKFLVKALEKLGCKVVKLYCNPDGNFPNHLPDPNEKNLSELSKLIIKEKADFGLGIDGDGDRIRLVSNKGEIIANDLLFALLARDILMKKRGVKVVYSVACSDIVKDLVKESGGRAVKERVGHTYIKAKMVRVKAEVGIEVSGHIFFKENYSNDDAIFAGLKIVELISKNVNFWGELKDFGSRYFNTPLIRVNCPEGKKGEVLKKIKKDLVKEKFRVEEKSYIRATKKEGWILVRRSNTEEKLSIRVEAKTKKDLNILKKLIMKIVKQYLK